MPSPASLACAFAGAGLPLWHADRLAEVDTPVAATGFAALDAELPGGGWPLAGLTELLSPAPGGGELPLLAPALRAGTQPLLCIAPPWRPYGPAWRALGLALERLVWVDAQPGRDASWAAEQALRSRACGWVLLWWHDAAPLRPETLRRLHLGALESGCPLLLLRPQSARERASPAPLRLALAPEAPGQLRVEVFKRRGPPQAQALRLALPLPRHARLRPRSAMPVIARDARENAGVVDLGLAAATAA